MPEFWVNHYADDEHGAPDYGTAPGDLIKLLRATLVTGYGSVAVNSVVVQQNGMHRVSFTSTKTFRVSSVVELSGLSPGVIDGKYVVEAAGPGFVDVLLPSAPSGVVGATVKKPPVGTWSYRDLDGVNTTGVFTCNYSALFSPELKVTDTSAVNNTSGAKGAKVEAFDDVKTLQVPFYSPFWQKRHAGNTSKVWTVVVEKRGFWVVHDMWNTWPSITYFGYVKEPIDGQLPFVALNGTEWAIDGDRSSIGNYPRVFSAIPTMRASRSAGAVPVRGVVQATPLFHVLQVAESTDLVVLPRAYAINGVSAFVTPGGFFLSAAIPERTIVDGLLVLRTLLKDGFGENVGNWPADSHVGMIGIDVLNRWDI